MKMKSTIIVLDRIQLINFYYDKILSGWKNSIAMGGNQERKSI
jgi:hypothetical protein